MREEKGEVPVMKRGKYPYYPIFLNASGKKCVVVGVVGQSLT